MSAAPAGWYDQHDGTERFWSGSEWTVHHRPLQLSDRAVLPPAGGGAAVRPNGRPGGTMTGPTVAPKSPGLALLCSFFVPGLGQLVNGDAGKGVLMFVGYLLSFALMVVLVGFLTAPAIWVWGMVDAYQGAQRWNLQHGVIS